MSLQMRDLGTAVRYVEVQLVLEQSENDLILNQCWLNGLLILQKKQPQKTLQNNKPKFDPKDLVFL